LTAALVKAVRTLELALGRPRAEPTPSEARGRQDYRLSCVARRDLPAGHVLQEQDWAYSRPGTGISPADAHRLARRMLKRAVSAGQALTFDLLE